MTTHQEECRPLDTRGEITYLKFDPRSDSDAKCDTKSGTHVELDSTDLENYYNLMQSVACLTGVYFMQIFASIAVVFDPKRPNADDPYLQLCAIGTLPMCALAKTSAFGHILQKCCDKNSAIRRRTVSLHIAFHQILLLLQVVIMYTTNLTQHSISAVFADEVWNVWDVWYAVFLLTWLWPVVVAPFALFSAFAPYNCAYRHSAESCLDAVVKMDPVESAVRRSAAWLSYGAVLAALGAFYWLAFRSLAGLVPAGAIIHLNVVQGIGIVIFGRWLSQVSRAFSASLAAIALGAVYVCYRVVDNRVSHNWARPSAGDVLRTVLFAIFFWPMSSPVAAVIAGLLVLEVFASPVHLHMFLMRQVIRATRDVWEARTQSGEPRTQSGEPAKIVESGEPGQSAVQVVVI